MTDFIITSIKWSPCEEHNASWRWMEHVWGNQADFFHKIMLILWKELNITRGARKSSELNQMERCTFTITGILMNEHISL